MVLVRSLVLSLFYFCTSFTAAQAKLIQGADLAKPSSESQERVVRLGVLLETDAQGKTVPVCEFPAAEAAPQWLHAAAGPSQLRESGLPKCSPQQTAEVAQHVRKASLNQQAGLTVIAGSFMCATVAASAAYLSIRNSRLRGTIGAAVGVYTGSIATGSYMNGVAGTAAGFSKLLRGVSNPVLCYLVGEGLGEAARSVGYIWERL